MQDILNKNYSLPILVVFSTNLSFLKVHHCQSGRMLWITILKQTMLIRAHIKDEGL